MNIENNFDASVSHDANKTGRTITGVSSDLIEDNIRANLEPTNTQISTLTQLLNHTIQDNPAKTTLTAGSYTHRPPNEPSLSREAETSKTLPETAIGVTGLSPDRVRRNFGYKV